MGNGDIAEDVRRLASERAALEKQIESSSGALTERRLRRYELEYDAIQSALAKMFRTVPAGPERAAVVVEMLRNLESRLVLVENFTVDPTGDNRILARLVARFLPEVGESGLLPAIELDYFRAIICLYAGDFAAARDALFLVCESEEPDETSDLKFKAYVMLGNLYHEHREFERARDLHDKSLRYTSNDNVAAQALAFKALNSFALGELDEARELFVRSLALFDREAPFFNSYFHRNALLFCGLIHYRRKEYTEAESYYRQVIETVERQSFDYFDSLVQIGRICFATGRFDEAAEMFRRAISSHRTSETEQLVDAWFWLGRAHVERGDRSEAARCLRNVVGSAVRYEHRPQAVALLERIEAKGS
jgi:tetratricopeptide (TPR) repeat protein